MGISGLPSGGTIKRRMTRVAQTAAGQTPTEYQNYLDQLRTGKQQLAQSKQRLDIAKQAGLVKSFEEALAGGGPMPTQYEIEAGVMPQKYQGIRDESGQVRSQFKLDPYQGEAMQALKGQAFSQGQSPWAQMQLQQQQMEEQGQREGAARQGQQALSTGLAGLARMGGVSSGARERLGGQSSRDIMLANQQIARQGAGSRLGIGGEDIQRKEQLLRSFGQQESQAQQGNLQNLLQDVQGQQMFDVNRYNKQLEAWGAKQSANAQRAAASGGGKK